MKKLLVVGLITLSAVGFAGQGNGNMNTTNFKQNQKFSKNNKVKGRMFENMTPAQIEAMKKERIAIDEKKLEIRKLMVTSTPDWKKVEKANLELATMRAKSQTEKMKLRHEAMQKAQVTKSN